MRRINLILYVCLFLDIGWRFMTKWLTHILLVFFSYNCAVINASESDHVNNQLHSGIFLIASERLDQSALSHTVIYLVQHSEEGTSGFIINRPTASKVNQAFPEIHASDATNSIVYFGGPLHTDYLFILTQTQYTKGLFPVENDIYFGTGDQVPLRLQGENKRDKIRSYAGFMIWGPEQLQEEIKSGDWVTAPASIDVLFSEEPDNIWKKLYDRWAGSWI